MSIKVIACSLLMWVQAAFGTTLEGFNSPSTVVLSDGNKQFIVQLSGSGVAYCGDEYFRRAVSGIVGKRVELNGANDIVFVDDGMRLDAVLSQAGWLYVGGAIEGQQEAMAERRGGWACAPQTALFQVFHQSVDPRILASIAMNESNYAGHPWPWTLNVSGRPFFFRSREDAYKAIVYLIQHHQCMFDVGLMQVNWCYNGKRFSSPWDALEPMENIRVAEQILIENYRKSGSPATAVAWYHSANAQKGTPYLMQFISNLKKIEAGS